MQLGEHWDWEAGALDSDERYAARLGDAAYGPPDGGGPGRGPMLTPVQIAGLRADALAPLLRLIAFGEPDPAAPPGSAAAAAGAAAAAAGARGRAEGRHLGPLHRRLMPDGRPRRVWRRLLREVCAGVRMWDAGRQFQTTEAFDAYGRRPARARAAAAETACAQPA